MSELACPLCEMEEVLDHPDKFECVICGHEWDKDSPDADEPDERVVNDAYGNVLANGDIVAMIKVLQSGMKSKPIRLVDGDHEIDCKMDGIAIALKACFVKKVNP
jgi:protein PhnA